MLDLKKIPQKPGVYIYKNQTGQIIYIGKAINLRRRVSQYFQRDDALGPKTSALVSQIANISYHVVNSDIEALVLEANLIKRHQPKYNSSLKDDKSYRYIVITRDLLPKIFPAHTSQLQNNDFVYGPFPNSSAVNSLLKTIRRIFPFYGKKNHGPKTCLYCHLHLCPGPNPDPKIYRANIGKIKKILSGNFKLLQKQLKSEIRQFSRSQNYEAAIPARDQLAAINYIVGGWHNLQNMFQDIKLPSDQIHQASQEILSVLKPHFSIKSLSRIECFDVSNLGHKYFVAAMSVFQNGRLDHSQYRQFKIKTKQIPDDQFMLREVVYRRLRHTDWPYPNLILVDGGKPQVSSILKINKIISTIGLAKKEELIVLKTNTGFKEIKLPATSSGLKLLQSLRDEAHRFANRYRKKLLDQSLH